jgi:cold shock CspA family protein
VKTAATSGVFSDQLRIISKPRPDQICNSATASRSICDRAQTHQEIELRDQDSRHSRRREFDGNTYHPQPRAFGTRPRFSQPRFEAPSGPPVHGIVKWFNPEKGFGFVELSDGSGDAFLHGSVLAQSGINTVQSGETLEVRVGPGGSVKYNVARPTPLPPTSSTYQPIRSSNDTNATGKLAYTPTPALLATLYQLVNKMG